MREIALAILLMLFSSCSFVQQANEFKARGRIDLLFPLDLIPGLDSILPHFVLDLSGGFEWENSETKHRHEMEKLRLEMELKVQETTDEETFEELVLNAFRTSIGDSNN